ncbi:hypothetical protein PVAP13_5NG051424 [Panicum virgatum]|uniref:Uncharacterized protein n=1 Tax=Panicum virgatum TaxID=38727 RepID=A0A8T0RNV5_PANVG|nr:hypothetical protein PVAP13_5NG051424 [Panicum virgatum]
MVGCCTTRCSRRSSASCAASTPPYRGPFFSEFDLAVLAVDLNQRERLVMLEGSQSPRPDQRCRWGLPTKGILRRPPQRQFQHPGQSSLPSFVDLIYLCFAGWVRSTDSQTRVGDQEQAAAWAQWSSCEGVACARNGCCRRRLGVGCRQAAAAGDDQAVRSAASSRQGPRQ